MARPKSKKEFNPKRATMSLECRLRAKAISQESMGEASNRDIVNQLQREGFDPCPTAADIGQWKRSRTWSEPIHAPVAKGISEDIRQAVQLRHPDDLERIERSTHRFESLVEQAAAYVETQVKNVKIETPIDFKVMTDALRDLLLTQLAVTKSLQDLRQLRISALSGYGEILPPEKGEAEPKTIVGAQEEVLSNF